MPEDPKDLKIERQKFQLHKKGYEDIAKAIKEIKEEKQEVQKVSIEGVNLITIKGDKGDSPTEEELTPIITKLIPSPIHGKDGYSPVKNKDYFDGKDYILTEKDKKTIASNIKVPVIEKIIEKTEVIKEQPIVKEVAKYELAEDIAKKLADYKKEWLPMEAIIGDFNKRIDNRIGKTMVGISSIKQLTDVDYSGLSQDAHGNYILGSGGGGSSSWGGITGTLSDQTDLQTALNAKQDTLVSATNIKTINGSSILGSGDITISGGGSALTDTDNTYDAFYITDTGGTQKWKVEMSEAGEFITSKYPYTPTTAEEYVEFVGLYFSGPTIDAVTGSITSNYTNTSFDSIKQFEGNGSLTWKFNTPSTNTTVTNISLTNSSGYVSAEYIYVASVPTIRVNDGGNIISITTGVDVNNFYRIVRTGSNLTLHSDTTENGTFSTLVYTYIYRTFSGTQSWAGGFIETIGTGITLAKYRTPNNISVK
jgi:hypothetical protein